MKPIGYLKRFFCKCCEHGLKLKDRKCRKTSERQDIKREIKKDLDK